MRRLIAPLVGLILVFGSVSPAAENGRKEAEVQWA